MEYCQDDFLKNTVLLEAVGSQSQASSPNLGQTLCIKQKVMQVGVQKLQTKAVSVNNQTNCGLWM